MKGFQRITFDPGVLLRRFEAELANGALVVADELGERVRLLPLNQ